MTGLYLARHAETVYNRGARMQGATAHTPLTRTGIAQADAMGAALARHFGARAADVRLIASPTGRTLQTMAIIADHLGRDYFDIETDERLVEIRIGQWEGRSYADIVAESGPIVCEVRGIFSKRPPGGEWYPDMARRLADWHGAQDFSRPTLVISHGLTARVLRGLLVGGEPFEPGCVPIASEVPQGTVMRIVEGREEMILEGTGRSGAGRRAF